MPPLYQKPENALKRAEELIAVSQQGSALLLLHEIILSKRAKTTPLIILEPIVVKFIELAVDLGKGKMAKDALMAYKNIAQNTSVGSFEVVIKKFLDVAESRLNQAQVEAKKILVNVEDLEAAENPETLMMNTVSSDDSKDRTDREVVTPWLRFLWEAYRTVLDIIRNNVRLEVLYQVFLSKFCINYGRRTEFRRLCEILRQHLYTTQKYAHQQHAVDLNDSDTLNRHLDTRFKQLYAAAKLDHDQEGFKSIEDICGLLDVSQKQPSKQRLASYYKTLADILQARVGDNILFHSAAYSKYYELKCSDQNVSASEKSLMATISLVSALAIQSNGGEDEKTIRLTQVLRSSSIPTREALLARALRKDIYSLVWEEAKELYQILEVRFHPLVICQKITPLLEAFKRNKTLEGYVAPLRRVVLTRLLQQLSQVYTTIKIDFLVNLFPAPFEYNRYQIEKFIMNGCKRGDFKIRMDHLNNTLHFVPENFGAMSADVSFDKVKCQLTGLLKGLEKVALKTDPNAQELKRKEMLNALHAVDIPRDRNIALFQLALIEKKKELHLAELARQEEERLKMIAEEQRQEKIRQEEDLKRREQERLIQQRKEIEKREAKKLAEKLTEELRAKNVKIDQNDLANLDTKKLLELQEQHLEKQQKEIESKIKFLSKRYDHIERAFRKEEIPLLEKDFEAQQKKDIVDYEQRKETLLKSSKIKFDQDMERKKRFSRMLKEYNSFKAQLDKARDAHYAKLQKEADEKCEIEIKKHMEELKLAQEREEEEKKQRALEEERLAKEKEEAERQRLAEEEKQRKEKELENPASKFTSSGRTSAWKPSGRSEWGRRETDRPPQETAWRREPARPPSREPDAAPQSRDGAWKSLKPRDSEPRKDVYRPPHRESTGKDSLNLERSESDGRAWRRPQPADAPSTVKSESSDGWKTVGKSGPPRIGQGKWRENSNRQ